MNDHDEDDALLLAGLADVEDTLAQLIALTERRARERPEMTAIQRRLSVARWDVEHAAHLLARGPAEALPCAAVH